MIIENNDTLVSLKDLKISFYLRQGVVRAVDGVTFEIKRGKTIGLVGESGCGKSVTSKALLRIEAPGKIIDGQVLFYPEQNSCTKIHELSPNCDKIRAIRYNEISMIFQEPMMSFGPMHTIGNQISEAILVHRDISAKEALHLAIKSLKSVGMSRPEKVIKQYPHQLSGGMRQRAMIAMAMSCEPKLLIADEPTTALDVTTEAQILALLKEKQQLLNMTFLYITHNLAVISQIADEVVVMYLGKIVEHAPVDTLFNTPRHPYTQALMNSIPRVKNDPRGKLHVIQGDIPDPYTRPSGCYFHPRCSHFITDICDKQAPPMYTIENSVRVACHLYSNN